MYIPAFPPAPGQDGSEPPPTAPADPVDPTAPVDPVDPGPRNWEEGVTRKMCAATYLRFGFADHANGALVDPSYNALAPSWGVDLVALARHAHRSRMTRLARDTQLRWCFAAMVAAMAFALIAVPVFGLPVGVAVLLLGLVIPLASLATAWAIVARHYWWTRERALEVFNDKNPTPRDLAPSLADQGMDLGPRIEDRLERLGAANVVLFGNYLPFVGDGVPLDTWTLTVDLTRKPGLGGNGAEEEAPAFTVKDVYDHLLEHFPDESVAGVRTGVRLYVAGPWSVAQSIPGLVTLPPDMDDRPQPQVADSVVADLTENPIPQARTFACFWKSNWGGNLLVSLLVRAERSKDSLFIEGRSHVLLPLHDLFSDVEKIPPHSNHALWPLVKSVSGVFWGLYFGAFGRHNTMYWAGRAWMKEMKEKRKRIERKVPWNYGATSSLREEAADVDALPYYATVDEVKYFRVLKHRVLSCLQEFLEEQNVDLREFKRQRNLITYQTTVYLHSVGGTEANFGSKNTVMVKPAAPPLAGDG